MSFAEKWMELRIMMLSEGKAKLKKSNITCTHSFVEPRPKIMVLIKIMIINMEHEWEWGGGVRGGINRR
jgi:hypothetical protein